MVEMQKRSNSALWIGLLFTVLAILSQGLFFLKVPGQRILPWLNLALAVIALILLIVGLKRAFTQPRVFRGKVAGSILAVISVLVFAVTLLGFIHSREMPSAADAPQVGQKVPEFTLADSNGNQVSLAQLLSSPMGNSSPKAVLLVFYRGYW